MTSMPSRVMSPTGISPRTRGAAGLVALVALAGLVVQFFASLDLTGSAGAALWSMLRFFTIIANGLTMLAMAAIALDKQAALRPRLIGCITLTMLLVGVVYVTLLRGTVVLSSLGHVADILLHYVMPLLVLAFWLLCAPKGGLTPGDPIRWVMLPLAYLPYALARAAQDGRYAYPFIDADTLGWPQVLINAVGIAFGFILVGFGLVWLDRRMGRR